MQIHHIALTVRNLEESARFYIDHFGYVQVLNFEREDMKAKAVHLQGEYMTLELWQFRAMQPVECLQDLAVQGIRHLAFAVDDLEVAVARFREKGVQCTSPQHGASGHRYVFLTDPDGIPLELYEQP